MPRPSLNDTFPHFWPEVRTKLDEHDDALDKIDGGSTSYHNGSESPVAAGTGAISLTVRTTYLTLDGTDARTMAAPTFAGQVKEIYVIAGSNTPVLALTVTGMRVTTADVYTSGTWTGTNAPLGLIFRSSDGLAWDPPVMIGSWTIS